MDLAFPVEFMLALAVTVALIVEALSRFQLPWTKPAIAVYATVGAWYLLDFYYNGSDYFANTFRQEIIGTAFLEVIWFLLAYRLFIAILARAPDPNPGNSITPRSESIWQLFWALTAAEIVFSLIGLVRLDFDFMNLIYPPAAEEHNYLWGRGGVGQGLDFLVSSANYTHIAVVGMLGVLASISPSMRLRVYSSVVFLAALPPFAFQRARNMILAVIMPGLLAFTLNSRYSPALRAGVTGVMFALIYAWFLVLAEYRGRGHDWSQVNAVELQQSFQQGDSAQKHQGLDMLSELCYINTFIDNGQYQVNLGERYFAEIVTVVPRAVWPSKPFIGIDYAIVRGFGDSNAAAGVGTSVATGMIGQGVVNFGSIFGPMAAALLMALWTRILAFLWIQRQNFAKLCLFMLGLGLTFNMGRDITSLVLFPFIFGWFGVTVAQRWFAKK